MILPDDHLISWATRGGLTPCDVDCINPASVDLKWSGRVKVAGKETWGELKEVDTLKMVRGEFYLLDTLEFITIPLNCAGILMLKSSLGRQGLEHSHAGYFDPGFRGTGTLELHVLSPWPITLTKGQRIVQLALEELKAAPSKSYFLTGRYNDQSEPTPSR